MSSSLINISYFNKWYKHEFIIFCPKSDGMNQIYLKKNSCIIKIIKMNFKIILR